MKVRINLKNSAGNIIYTDNFDVLNENEALNSLLEYSRIIISVGDIIEIEEID